MLTPALSQAELGEKRTMNLKKAFAACALSMLIPVSASAMCWTEKECAEDYKTQTAAIVDSNFANVQRSVSGFFNTLSLKKENTKAGLTILWTSSHSVPTHQSGGSTQLQRAFDHGYAVATGKFSSQGCPEFEVTVFQKSSGTHGDRIAKRGDVLRAICP